MLIITWLAACGSKKASSPPPPPDPKDRPANIDRIVEKVAGMPLFDLLTERVFKPLGMVSVQNTVPWPSGCNAVICMVDSIFSRNWLFIPEPLQAALTTPRILVAGTGLGSEICELAARTGFSRFILADGDRVELTNLNRQAFSREHVGTNKAEALATRIRALRPEVELTVVPRFLERTDLAQLVPEVDAVINTIDFDHPAFMDCSALARAHGKLELFPTNVGFGGSVACFDARSPLLSEHFGTRDHVVLKRRILEFLVSRSPAYIHSAYEAYVAGPRPCDPQLGISSYVTAAIAVTLLVRSVAGQPLRLFPDIYHADFNEGRALSETNRFLSHSDNFKSTT